MGNDIDVCSKDSYIDEYFDQENGPSKETTWQFFSRSSDRFVNSLVNPRRMSYSTQDLHPSRYSSPIYSIPADTSWECTEFNVFSQNVTLHCAFWKVKNSAPISFPVCILYLHTNLRSLVDALEVLPLAASLSASILSVDLPGCGQSKGQLSASMDKDIEHLLEWTKCLAGDDVKVLIWARGLATAPAIALCAQPQPQAPRSPALAIVHCLVLDSPFTGIKDMVKAALERMHGRGFTLSKALLQWATRRVLSQLSQRLHGLDLFSIQPILQVPYVRIPASILSADDDDYIPLEHGRRVAGQWRAPVQLQAFAGKHFGARGADLVRSVLPFVGHFLGIAGTEEPVFCPSARSVSVGSADSSPGDAGDAEEVPAALLDEQGDAGLRFEATGGSERHSLA
jgi:hypothetical protein